MEELTTEQKQVLSYCLMVGLDSLRKLDIPREEKEKDKDNIVALWHIFGFEDSPEKAPSLNGLG